MSTPPAEQRRGYLLQSKAALRSAAEEGVLQAKRLGFNEVKVSVRETAGTQMRVRDGKIEAAVKDGALMLEVAIFNEGRLGRASTAALDRQAVAMAVERASDIARLVQPDEDAQLTASDWLAWEGKAPPMFAPSELTPTELAQDALITEAAALDAARRAGVNGRVSEAAASSHDLRWVLATSQGFCRQGASSLHLRSCRTIAEADGQMNGDGWHSHERRWEALEPNAEIAATAMQRAARMLGAKGLETMTAPVLFDATRAGALVGELCEALNGRAQFQRRTFLAGALGAQVAAEHLDLIEDPFEPYGMASAAFDSDGVAGAHRSVLAQGVAQGYFLSALSARRLKMRSTGNADGPLNLHFTSRLTSAQDDHRAMLHKLDRGLWVTELLGGGVNPTTGAFSKAVMGFWVEGGEPLYPVADITVAGELNQMLRQIVAVGSDVHRQGNLRSGSILVEQMRIGGR